jgi:hypothetical protein
VNLEKAHSSIFENNLSNLPIGEDGMAVNIVVVSATWYGVTPKLACFRSPDMEIPQEEFIKQARALSGPVRRWDPETVLLKLKDCDVISKVECAVVTDSAGELYLVPNPEFQEVVRIIW